MGRWAPVSFGFAPARCSATRDGAISAMSRSIRLLLIAVVSLVAVCGVGAVSAQAATQNPPGISISTLDVQGQLVFFRLTNTLTNQVAPVVTVSGSGIDGTPISVPEVSLGQLLPNESTSAEIPLGTTPANLSVTVRAGQSQTTATWPLAEGGIQELRPGGTAPSPPNPGNNTALVVAFTLVALFFVLITARIVWVSGRVTRTTKRAIKIRNARLEAGRRAIEAGMTRLFPPPAGTPITEKRGGATLRAPSPAALIAPVGAPAPAALPEPTQAASVATLAPPTTPPITGAAPDLPPPVMAEPLLPPPPPPPTSAPVAGRSAPPSGKRIG